MDRCVDNVVGVVRRNPRSTGITPQLDHIPIVKLDAKVECVILLLRRKHLLLHEKRHHGRVMASDRCPQPLERREIAVEHRVVEGREALKDDGLPGVATLQ